MTSIRPPDQFFLAAHQHAIRFTRDLLWVRIASQSMWRFQVLRCPCAEHAGRRFPDYIPVERYRISTSRFGIGEIVGSNMTPRGLHRIAEKIGGGWPAGTVFKHRQVVGFTWKGFVPALITTRIMWLEGLQSGFNRGGNVDSHERYIYIHGTGDETALGRPASHGCVHVAANDLIPLFEQLPSGTLVWISER